MAQPVTEILNYTLIASTLRLSTPLIFAALGGLWSERAGVINIALEGMMLAGAFSAAAVTALTGNAWVGVGAALLAGLMVAWIHASATITWRADQVVSGTAINLLLLGIPALLSGAIFGSTGATPQLPKDQVLPDLIFFDPQSSPILASIFNQKPLVYLAFLLLAGTAYLLARTSLGCDCGQSERIQRRPIPRESASSGSAMPGFSSPGGWPPSEGPIFRSARTLSLPGT